MGFFSNGIVQNFIAAGVTAIVVLIVVLLSKRFLKIEPRSEIALAIATVLVLGAAALVYWNVDLADIFDQTEPAQPKLLTIYVARIDGDDNLHDLRQSVISSLSHEFSENAEVLPAAISLTPDLSKSESAAAQELQAQAANFLQKNNGDVLVGGRADQIDGRSVLELTTYSLHVEYADGGRNHLDDDHLINCDSIDLQIYSVLTLEAQSRYQPNDPSYQSFIDKLWPLVGSLTEPEGVQGTASARLDFIVGSALRERWSVGKPISILQDALVAFQGEQDSYASIKSENQLFAIVDQAEIIRWLAVYQSKPGMLNSALQAIEQARPYVPTPDDGRSSLLELRIADLLVARTITMSPDGKTIMIHPDFTDLSEALQHYELAKQIAQNGQALHIDDIQDYEMPSISSEADDGIEKIQKMQEELRGT